MRRYTPVVPLDSLEASLSDLKLCRENCIEEFTAFDQWATMVVPQIHNSLLAIAKQLHLMEVCIFSYTASPSSEQKTS